MPIPQLKPQLVMRRDSLSGLPPLQLPEGYSMRTYRTVDQSDEAAWDRIISESFEFPEPRGHFARLMLADAEYRPERIFFVCRADDRTPVATASAWHRPAFGHDVGMLHYVGALRSETGRGLGLQVSLACLHKMQDELRTAAVLQTDDFRIPAIKTYLRLGFAPLIVDENQHQRWRDVFAKIGRTELLERFAAALSAPVFVPTKDSRRL